MNDRLDSPAVQSVVEDFVVLRGGRGGISGLW